MKDLQRIRFVAGNYERLQGLRLLPWALLFYLVAFRDSGFDWAPLWLQPGDQTVTLPAFLLAGVLYLAIGWWYREVFGRVTGRRVERGRNALEIIGVVGFLFIYFFMAWFDATSRPPISFTIMSVAALIIVYWWVSGRFRSLYLAIAGVLACVSLLPALGIIDAASVSGLVGSSLIVGTVLVVVGVLDHAFLVRTMKPATEEDDARAI